MLQRVRRRGNLGGFVYRRHAPARPRLKMENVWDDDGAIEFPRD